MFKDTLMAVLADHCLQIPAFRFLVVLERRAVATVTPAQLATKI